MANDMAQNQLFLLDFSDTSWSAADVVKSVFLGGRAVADPEEMEAAVTCVIKNMRRKRRKMPVNLCPETKTVLDNLSDFLQGIKPALSASTEMAPIAWARLAVQFWLLHGGSNEEFLSKFSEWMTDQENAEVIVTRRRKPSLGVGLSGSKRLRIRGIGYVMSSFILEPYPKNHFTNCSVRVRAITNEVAEPSARSGADRKEKLKKSLGANLYDCVERIIEDAVANRCIPNISKKKEAKNGRYQHTGLHSDLCKEIYRYYADDIKQYKKSTLEKAIRGFVASRRSWR